MTALALASLLFAVIGGDLIFKNNSPTPELRKLLSEKPGPFIPLIEPSEGNTEEGPLDAKDTADRILQQGFWSYEKMQFSLKPPYRWDLQPRSYAFHVNAWDPLLPFLLAFSQTGETRYFDEAYRLAFDWTKTQMPPAFELKTREELDAFIGKPEDFIWYDMGVGLRVHPMAWILRSIAADENYSDEEVKLFADTLYFHMEALCRPKFFKGHNNHGFYQAVGQLAAARLVPELPGMKEYADLAEKRLEELVARQFSSEGIHLEHSPGYHEMLLRTFLAIRANNLVDNAGLLKMIDQMEEGLAWMVAPDFTLASLGDTQPEVQTASTTLLRRYNNPHLKYQMSLGKIGDPPQTGVKAYPDAGYAFMRFLPRREDDFASATYLAQTAAFHSRTHKHADHLSFVWYENGKPVLIDPGRYGYIGRTEPGSPLHAAGFWYSDPNRIYVESTRAHNTVEIDGKDFPRVKVKPFGSALLQAEEQKGLAITECALSLTKTQRFRRILVLKPGEFLLVIDQLDDVLTHDYTQWFTFAPEWNVTQIDSGYKAKREGMKALRVLQFYPGVQPLPVFRGQKEPRMQGWYSNRYNHLTPASSIGFEQRDAQAGRFVTLFAFAKDVEADPSEQQLPPDLSDAVLTWRADGKFRRLYLGRRPDGTLQVRLENKRP